MPYESWSSGCRLNISEFNLAGSFVLSCWLPEQILKKLNVSELLNPIACVNHLFPRQQATRDKATCEVKLGYIKATTRKSSPLQGWPQQQFKNRIVAKWKSTNRTACPLTSIIEGRAVARHYPSDHLNPWLSPLYIRFNSADSFVWQTLLFVWWCLLVCG